jgi:DNA-binding transcriptional LysR family regulator
VDRLRQLEVFTRIAELGSLSRAAESLGMSNAAASRHLAAIEERLSVRLIERNTRRLWLTEAGQEFLNRCETLLNDFAEAEEAVNERMLSPKGLLRVTSSLSFAMIYIAPILPSSGAFIRSWMSKLSPRTGISISSRRVSTSPYGRASGSPTSRSWCAGSAGYRGC